VTQVFGKEKAQLVMGSIEYTALMKTMKLEASRIMSAALPKVLEWLFFIVKLGWKILMSLVLAVIFSFILVFDWQRIAAAVKSLEQSRIRTFYHDTAPHLVAFANVLGRAFRAQVLVAVCNTTLTAAGLWFFDVPNITLLATIVFICGFIPILGTFLSSIPIMLFALPVGGLLLVLKLILLIAVVHALEAYVLNPRITANILHIHPILVLILLLLGERFCGLWGMVLGVPIGYYVISVLAHRDESLPAEDPERPPAA
jgi:predicted PurR-regulated permease PerM